LKQLIEIIGINIKIFMGADLIMLIKLYTTPIYVMAAPPAKMVKEVVDYFYEGQTEGPILADAKLCKTVKSISCEEPADPKAFSS
jgi:hypothetical protein